MNKTTIYFIRHGEILNPKKEFYGRSLDLLLSDEGRKQAQKIAEVIKSNGVKVSKIYTSPLNRAGETAKVIAQRIGEPIIPIIIGDGLTDVYIPVFIGHPISERDEIHNRGEDEYSRKYVERGNESREQIEKRMLREVKKIREENIGKTVIVISHGDPLRFLLYGLNNPDKPIPLIGKLKRSYYPEKGEGWKMVFDENGKIIEKEAITREGKYKFRKDDDI